MLKTKSAAFGTACCVMAAIFYTLSNICMRQVAALGCDPGWAVCVKETITVLAVGPFLIYRAWHGLPVLPPAKILFILVLAGLADQLVGNLGWQWSVGIVGLAVTVPASFGVMITSSAFFGRIILGEIVTPRSMGAIALLLASLALLGVGAEAAGTTAAPSAGELLADYGAPSGGALLAAGAVLAAAVAGAAYALLSIAIRHTMNAETQQSTLMFIITGMGTLTLGPASVHRLGWDGLLATPRESFAWLFAAGIFNLLGFICLTKGLHLTTVVRANVINASQVAMAAAAGMLMFRESPNSWLILGVGLTLMGICLIDRPVAEEAVEPAL